MSAPAAPGYKPTTEQMLALWVNRRANTPLERIEAEVGFYEWLDENGEGWA
jgi:hypothetical protein